MLVSEPDLGDSSASGAYTRSAHRVHDLCIYLASTIRVVRENFGKHSLAGSGDRFDANLEAVKLIGRGIHSCSTVQNSNTIVKIWGSRKKGSHGS